jgi:uncharacterized protein YaiI (UPF0178 family)
VTRILVDADGCPVKQEICKVAKRYGIHAAFVANTWMRIGSEEGHEMVVVDGDFNAADDWIAGQAAADDIVITADIPLAARCLAKGAVVLDPRGGAFSENTIGQALATRELMSHLRNMEQVAGGPAPFEPRDRSRFLQRLDETIQAARRKKS